MIDSSNESEIGFQLFESLNAHNSPIQIRSLKYQQIVNRCNAVFFLVVTISDSQIVFLIYR